MEAAPTVRQEGSMKRRFLISLVSVVLIVFSLTLAYGAERPLEKIHVGVPEVSVMQSPLFVAIDAGAFKRYGMDVEVMRLPGPQAMQALVGGSVQFAQGVSSRTVKIFTTDKNFTLPVLAKYTKITDRELLDKSYEYLKRYFLQVPYPPSRPSEARWRSSPTKFQKQKAPRPKIL